jgi:MerR-like DNA binding protein
MGRRVTATTAAGWARAAGITYRQLDYWARMGYLRPSQPAPGSGNWRRWSADERRVAVTMARLVSAGVAVPVAARVARAAVNEAEVDGLAIVNLTNGVSIVVDVPTVDVVDTAPL